MTHDELLAKIAAFSCCSGAHEAALCAVVELHKPIGKYCERCTVNNWGEEFQEYPCDVIQVIEKELG